MATTWALSRVESSPRDKIVVEIQEVVDGTPNPEGFYSVQVHKNDFNKAAIKSKLAAKVKAARTKEAADSARMSQADFADLETIIGGLV